MGGHPKWAWSIVDFQEEDLLSKLAMAVGAKSVLT